MHFTSVTLERQEFAAERRFGQIRVGLANERLHAEDRPQPNRPSLQSMSDQRQSGASKESRLDVEQVKVKAKMHSYRRRNLATSTR
jgi:hypothetical protein